MEVLDPQKNESILDPACGTAGFLISAYKHIIKNNSENYDPQKDTLSFARNEPDALKIQIQSNGRYKGDQLKPMEWDRITKNIAGYDISPDMVKFSLVNMYLHKFKQPQIYEYDTLTSETRWGDDFDVILANPPFMSPKGGIRPHQKFSVQSNRSEVLFVDYIAEHLKVGGRAGVIVPEGVIFKGDKAYKQLRKMLVENRFLWAVVSLPAGIFQPYSGVKTSILFLDRQRAKVVDKILFVDVASDGFDLGATRRKVDRNDLPEAFKVLCQWQEGQKQESVLAHWVSRSKIAESDDWNLSGGRYKEAKVRSSRWPLVALGDVCEILSGQSPKGEYYNFTGKGMAFYQGKTEFTEKYIGPPRKWTTQITQIAKENDVLISVRAPVGPVNLSTNEICIGRGLAAIRDKSGKTIQRYLFYLLKQKQADISRNTGSTFESINKQDIQKIKIPLPPLEVQRELVSEIEGYEKVIDGARQVVKHWKPTIKINPTWPLIKLGDICDVRDGTHDSPKYISKGIPLITSKNLKNHKITFDNINFISEQDHIKISKRSRVDDGDVLFGMIGTIGNPVVVSKNREFSIKNVALFKFKQNKKLLNYFLQILLDSKFTEDHLIIKSRGGSQKFVSLADLRNFKIPLPPLEVQREIVSKIEQERQFVESNKKLIECFKQKIDTAITSIYSPTATA